MCLLWHCVYLPVLWHNYSDAVGGERGDQAAAAAAADPGQLQAQTGGQTQPPPVMGLVTDNFDIDVYQ